jgi:hypothetical protein
MAIKKKGETAHCRFHMPSNGCGSSPSTLQQQNDLRTTMKAEKLNHQLGYDYAKPNQRSQFQRRLTT